MKIQISQLRQREVNDRAIVDLLHLVQLKKAPGRIKTKELTELWGCHQSTISRRMAAIAELGCCTVRSSWSGYTISQEKPKTKARRTPQHRPDPVAAAKRWEALRSRWQKVAA